MKILFAAPDRDLLEAYRILLTSVDDEVDTAFDGPQVLSKLAENSYDLLIMAEEMPRVESGRILQSCDGRQIPVIMMTASSLSKTLADTSPYRVREYISLPFTPGELKAAVTRAGEAG